MRLALTVRTHKGVPCKELIRTEFSQEGGRIGRSPDSDLVLEDTKRIVSNSHAEVSFHDGAFYLKDISSNGVFVNRSAEAVGRGQRVRLRHGDVLGMGDYELAVELEHVGGPEARPSQPLPRTPDPFATSEPQFSIPDDPELFGAEDGGLGLGTPASASAPLLGKSEAVDPLDLLGGPAVIRRAQAPGAIEDHLPSEQSHFTPPRPIPETTPNAIPDDWDKTGRFKAPTRPAAPPSSPPRPSGATPTLPEDWDLEEPPTPRSTSPPAAGRSALRPAAPEVASGRRPEPSPAASGGSPLQAFLAAAGLSPAKGGERPTDDLLRDAGVILREFVAGMMKLLAARSASKSEFRIEGTMIRPVENNPLKFSADAREALEHLLLPSGKAYLAPGQAVREGIQNLQDHKVALLAAMRAALEALLARFAPDALEARFGERGKPSLMGLSGKGRYWEMYRELFAELRRNPDALFDEVLGENFVRAYEEQVELLSKSRR